MEATELEVVLSDAGVEVTRVARDEVYAHCPNPQHADRNASWSMNSETLVHFCFSCGYRGNLEALLLDLTGRAPDNVKDLIVLSKARRYLEKEAKKAEPSPEPEPEVFVSEWQLATYIEVPYRECVGRMLVPELVDEYGVRWDPDHRYWIIPVRDFDGKLLGWQEKGKDHFKNVPTGMEKSKSLFGFERLRGRRAVLVESPLDVVRLATAGIDYGVASYGAHVSKDQMLALIDRVETPILALDHDKAGRKSMLSIIEDWKLATNLKIVRYRKDDPKDVGEMTDHHIRRLINESCNVVRGVHR